MMLYPPDSSMFLMVLLRCSSIASTTAFAVAASVVNVEKDPQEDGPHDDAGANPHDIKRLFHGGVDLELREG